MVPGIADTSLKLKRPLSSFWAKLQDLASISSPPGRQPLNYVGYKKRFVDMDSRFANAGYALRSNARLFQWLRQASVDVSFSCWPQPDLYPMDLIQVNDWRTGLETLPLFIMSTSTTNSVLGGKRVDTCRIQAKYLDPTVLGSF